MNKISQVVKSAEKTIAKHGPQILTGLGVAGFITSVGMAVTATPKAIRLIEDKETELEFEKGKTVRLTKGEIVKTCWKCYVPTAITCVLSASCIIGANSVSNRRTAALATAYKLSETALTEYQDKVVELVGKKKEQEIRDEVAKDKLEKNPVVNREVIITEKGNTLCYDVISGRYFRSDIDKIRRAENAINKRLLDEMYVALNDFYYEIGLDSTSMGDDIGWNIDKGLLDIHFTASLADDDMPCLVLDYKVAPMYGYDH